MVVYRYTVDGVGVSGQTWETSGRIALDLGDLPDLMLRALKESFLKLTRGEALFGRPGVGCDGPYKVMRVLFEAAEVPK